MKKGLFTAAISFFYATNMALGQGSGTSGTMLTIPDAREIGQTLSISGTRGMDSPCALDCCGSPNSTYRVWGSAEYLLWWTKNNGLASPLITTSSNPNAVDAAGNNVAGGLGRSGTSVLLSGNDINYGVRSGGRFVVGAWLDPGSTVGFEARGFFLAPNTYSATFASGGDGSPVIGIPVNVTNAVAGPLVVQNPGANAIAESFPGLFAGTSTVISHSRLWGIEANGVLNLHRNAGFQLDAIFGFRYADLREDISVSGMSSNLVPVAGGGGVSFLSNGTNNFYDGTVIATDFFGTRNQFAGGQLGLKGEAQFGSAFIALRGTVALGNTHQTLDIRGDSTLMTTAGATTQTNAGGTLALASNIGTYNRNQFSVIPEVDLRIGYNITSQIRAFVGYSFMYWSNVARPGDVINHNVDLRQIPTVPAYDPALRTQPLAQFTNTDYWAQGINFGFEVRY